MPKDWALRASAGHDSWALTRLLSMVVCNLLKIIIPKITVHCCCGVCWCHQRRMTREWRDICYLCKTHHVIFPSRRTSILLDPVFLKSRLCVWVTTPSTCFQFNKAQLSSCWWFCLVCPELHSSLLWQSTGRRDVHRVCSEYPLMSTVVWSVQVF